MKFRTHLGIFFSACLRGFNLYPPMVISHKLLHRFRHVTCFTQRLLFVFDMTYVHRGWSDIGMQWAVCLTAIA